MKTLKPTIWYCDKCESEQLMNAKVVDERLNTAKLLKFVREISPAWLPEGHRIKRNRLLKEIVASSQEI